MWLNNAKEKKLYRHGHLRVQASTRLVPGALYSSPIERISKTPRRCRVAPWLSHRRAPPEPADRRHRRACASQAPRAKFAVERAQASNRTAVRCGPEVGLEGSSTSAGRQAGPRSWRQSRGGERRAHRHSMPRSTSRSGVLVRPLSPHRTRSSALLSPHDSLIFFPSRPHFSSEPSSCCPSRGPGTRTYATAGGLSRVLGRVPNSSGSRSKHWRSQLPLGHADLH